VLDGHEEPRVSRLSVAENMWRTPRPAIIVFFIAQ
jgi:hypothetical protein